jgi:hypothetical protein
MSDKSVAERLQLKGARTLALLAAPAEIDAEIGVATQRSDVAVADVVLIFLRDKAALHDGLGQLLRQTKPQAILWVAYPKLTSALKSDIHRDIIREAAPHFGLDTVSQIAIDNCWSALRLKRV